MFSVKLGDVCYVEKYECKVIVYEKFNYNLGGVSRIAYISDEKKWFVTGRSLWITDGEFVVCGASCSITDDLLTPTGVNRVDLTQQISEHLENDFVPHLRKNKYEGCIKDIRHWINQCIIREFGMIPEDYLIFAHKAFGIMGKIGYHEIGNVMSKFEGGY